MRNPTYGFQHLEHRYRLLGDNDAPIIPVERRPNLNELLAESYGSDSAARPKFTSLMEFNGGRHRYFLTGEEEVQAFRNSEFIRMHNSTLCKVGFLHSIIRKLLSGKLKTASRGYGIALDRLIESRGIMSIGLFATLVTIRVGIGQALLWAG